MSRKVKVKISTFSLTEFTQNEVDYVIRDLDPSNIITINTLYIPATIKKIPIAMPITGEGNVDDFVCHMGGNSYIKVIVWYWKNDD